MEDIFRPKTVPAIILGTLEGSAGAKVNGQEYADAPRVGGGRQGTGTSGLCMRVGNGRAVIGTGGYYAPKSDLS